MMLATDTSPQAMMAAERDRIVFALQSLFQNLAGKRIFMTGGTGFIGRWMLEALFEANRRKGLGVEVDLLTRDPQAFTTAAPNITAAEGCRLIKGDVLRLAGLEGPYDFVLHAATDASAHLNETDPKRMFDTILEGTRAALDLALKANARRFFFFSSGAVYGAQPWDVTHVDEGFLGAPDLSTHRSAYGEGKRAAEMLCTVYGKQFGLDVVSARIFALLGPLLSLDIHFAAGNFIRDALRGERIVVRGSGRAVRSYLYASDLTVWLWTMLLTAQPGATYNVGSEEGISIAELAERTAALLGGPGFDVLGQEDPGWNPGRYVPSTAKIRKDLGVAPTVGLDEAILRTARWNGWGG